MNLAESLLYALKDHGAEEIFGIPGDFALPFFKVMEESSILPLYTLSHEPAVGFAADAAARWHSGLGVAAVTYGAGALNMVNPVAAAYAEKSPLVVISGAPGLQERGAGLLLHHQAKTLDSQLQIYEQITCDQVVLDDPQKAPAKIARALRNCLLHSRPVYIELPRDQVFSPCQAVDRLPSVSTDIDALDACADEIMEQLLAAQNPLMLVGVEIRRFGIESKVAELARKLALPVATTFMGRGLLVNTDAPLIGTYLGVAGDQTLTREVESSDSLLMLGVIMSDTNFGISQRQLNLREVIVAADGEVSKGYHRYTDIPLTDLVDALLTRAKETNGLRQDKEAAVYPSGLLGDDRAITPLEIAKGVNDMMAQHGSMPIASDVGDCLFTALDIDNTELVAPGYYATMGFGAPAGMGIQAASGRRPLILLGDGAFQMTGWELGNCPRHGWDPIVLLFNNKSWEMLRTFQPESKFNDLDDWGYAEIANQIGGVGHKVSTCKELAVALEQAVKQRGKFQLIEIMLERGVLSPRLASFAKGVKRLH